MIRVSMVSWSTGREKIKWRTISALVAPLPGTFEAIFKIFRVFLLIVHIIYFPAATESYLRLKCILNPFI